jgi:hypothetical protein
MTADREAAPNGAQVAAEAIAYDRQRRTDCKAGRSRPGMISGANQARLSRAVREPGGLVGSGRNDPDIV